MRTGSTSTIHTHSDGFWGRRQASANCIKDWLIYFSSGDLYIVLAALWISCYPSKLDNSRLILLVVSWLTALLTSCMQWQSAGSLARRLGKIFSLFWLLNNWKFLVFPANGIKCRSVWYLLQLRRTLLSSVRILWHFVGLEVDCILPKFDLESKLRPLRHAFVNLLLVNADSLPVWTYTVKKANWYSVNIHWCFRVKVTFHSNLSKRLLSL